MKKKMLLISGLACFALAWCGLCHSLLTLRKTEAQLTSHGQLTLEEAYREGDLYDAGIRLPFEYIVDGMTYTTMYEGHPWYPSDVPMALSVYHSELFPLICFHERPVPQPERMADALWGIGLVFILLSFRIKSPASCES